MEEYDENCDSDCKATGTRWTYIFALNGTVLFIILGNFCCFCLGMCNGIARGISLICNCMCALLLFITIIITGYIRFGVKGELCAMNDSGSTWNPVDNKVENYTTFRSDASLIATTFFLEMMLILCMCICGNVGAITCIKHMRKKFDD